ncbi:MAG: DNA mismatch repair protein MutS [Thermoanaerobaculia bacterium]|nr:DNA mismatch repair protein MutS [Thermoanaerobaculia bacterium]
MTDVRATYTTELAQRDAETNSLRSRERQISVARLAIIVAAIVAGAFSQLWLFIFGVAGFIALVVVHDRAIGRRKRAERSAAFYRDGLARLGDSWQGKGFAGDGFAEPHHPYAEDLDLFGRGSLFELLCRAVTTAGRTKLAKWLLDPAHAAKVIESRQQAVAELKDDLKFREEISVVATDVTGEFEAGRLEQWSAQPETVIAPWERAAALILPAITTVLLILSARPIFLRIVAVTNPETGVDTTASFPGWPLLLAVVIQLLFARHLGGRVNGIVSGVERAEPALTQLARLLALIENRTFRSARMLELHGVVASSDRRSSAEIARLRKLVGLLDARRNQMFAPFAMVLLWTTNLAIRIEHWRRESGAATGAWIDAVAEVEAIASLASISYENPEYAMPQIVAEAPCFDAAALGHPLIPAARRVANDIRLGDDLRLLLISGSNMSGKSTLMRSVGVAAVLAYAGGPVCARSLRIAPMALGASIRINDSLQEGSSRFYAEILRLRQILDLGGKQPPLLFLLDEILHGTNSHDRRIGAEAVVRALVAKGAAGLVSTHDLALANIVETLAPKAANVHFEDHIEDGKMVFDYQMRPGVVTKSNALALMRSVGIEV